MEKQLYFICNDKVISECLNPSITVLDFLRSTKKLTGTKEGCREGDCGACTVLLGSLVGNKVKYKSVNSCLLPLDSVNGKHLVSIEGLNIAELTFIQEQLVDEGGTQCGFCTPGFVVSLINYFLNNNKYKLEDAITALDGNICRCTGYAGIKRAIENTISFLGEANSKNRYEFLINKKILPEYFLEIPKQLKKINSLAATKSKKFKTAKFIVSGGTDIYVQQRDDIHLADVEFLSENNLKKKIWKTSKNVFIAGNTTVEELRESKIIQKHFPDFKKQLLLFGSMPIRNRATVAGNIVNASPIADIANILLVLDADVHLHCGKKKRVVPIKDFYKGYKKLNKVKNEIIFAVSFAIPKKSALFNFEKVSRRTYLDIASVNSSISIRAESDMIEDIHISAGGVSPIPLYLRATRKFLLKKKLNTENIKQAANIALGEISPISDARGSAEYKRLLLRQLFYAHFIKLYRQNFTHEEFV
jgi:xanthine dehydrogenase small subunit